MNLPFSPKSAPLHLRAEEKGTVDSAVQTVSPLKYAANASKVEPLAPSAATMLVMMSVTPPNLSV